MKFILAVILSVFLVTACTTQTIQPQPEEQKTYKIGVLASMTGSAAVYGEAYTKGIQKAADEINAEGKKVEIIIEDNKNDPKEGIAAYERLKLKNPDIIFSTMSGPTQAIVPLAQADSKPVVMSLTITPINKNYPNSYRYFFSAEEYKHELVKFYKKNNVKTVALYYVNNEAGVNAANVLRKDLTEAGFTIIAEESTIPTETDHKTGLTKIVSKKPDTIFVWSLRPDLIAGPLKELYAGPVVYNEPAAVSRWYLTMPQFEGTYMMTFPSTVSNTPEGAKFNSVYGETQNGYAAFGYDVMKMVHNALENGATPNTLVSALSSMSTYEGTTGKMMFSNELREANAPMIMTQVKNKQLIRVDVN